MSQTEIAWAAGVFEGEGTIVLSSDRRRICLAVGSTDFDVLGRIHRIFGVGKIFEGGARPDKRGIIKSRKPMRFWKTWRTEDAERVLALIYPFLGERRKAVADNAIRTALQWWLDTQWICQDCRDWLPEPGKPIPKGGNSRFCPDCRTARARAVARESTRRYRERQKVLA